MRRRRALAGAPLWLASCAAAARPRAARRAASPRPRNLFAELLGQPESALDARLDSAWRHFVEGDPDQQRLVYEVPGDMAYVADVNNRDVRSEGMSYGMVLAVQLDRRDTFDRLWRWALTHMRHASGERAGYFAWQCRYDGTPIDPGSASDGEAWFAMALLMAQARWGRGGAFDYGRQAQALLRLMIHKPATARVTPIYHAREKQIVFAPTPQAAVLTDPSYHLPHFTEIWAQVADDAADRRFWREVTDTSRAFWRRHAHPQTGLMSEYAHFDGQPWRDTRFGDGKADFRYDAWRVLANVALDHAWWGRDAEWQRQQSNRVLRFLSGAQPPASLFTLDGQPLNSGLATGLVATAAVAGLAADAELARPWVQRLWDLPLASGSYRYYDGLLQFLALLQAGGRFRPWVDRGPAAPRQT